MEYTPKDPDFREKVNRAWHKQRFLLEIGLSLTRIEPGYCEVEAPIHEKMHQSFGYVAGGFLGTIADAVAGFAAYTLVPSDTAMLTSEYKINFLRPAVGDKLIARAKVEKYGRILSVVRAEVFTIEDQKETLVASASVTMISMKKNRPRK